MQLVVLAAGHGTRFGGLKQLEPVGPNGEALMDYTAISAAACGFASVVVVVREEIRAEIERHVRKHWPAELATSLVCQPPTQGTAQAVAAAEPEIDGPFGVANADDVYGEAAIQQLVDHYADPAWSDPVRGPNLLVAYRLLRTVLTAASVKRGLCERSEDGRLLRIVEHTVSMREDGRFDAVPLDSPGATTKVLSGSERTSMNLWGFHRRMFDHLNEALELHPRRTEDRELLLVDVVASLVDSGREEVRVVDTEARCLGVTHREDVEIVRDQLTGQPDMALPAVEAD